MNKSKFLIAIPITVLMLLVAIAGQVSASSVEPVNVAGNPTCEDLGFDFEYKIDLGEGGDYNGTFNIDAFNTVTISSADNITFDWEATLGMDAVIAKGGKEGANVYYYDPEAYSDSGLHPPTNPSGGYAAISHISFCYDYEVDVEKTAETTFTRTFDWSIDKSVSPDAWDLFTGDSGTSKYTVALTKTGYTDSDWAVSGTITIDNNTPFDATITGVSDVISTAIDGGANCGVTFPYILASDGTLECTYSTPLPDSSDRTNTATVTTTGIVGGNTATADVLFGDPTTEVNAEVNVTDTNGSSWGPVSDDATWTYEKTFDCDDEGKNDNTATITETGQSDDASVTVNCYDLTVTKNATTSFDRDWDWTIDKSADQTELMLSEGQQFMVNYLITLEGNFTDSNHAVSGDIWIANSNPSQAASLTEVTDLVSPDIAATVDCPALTVPAGGSLHCTYSTSLPDASSRTNTAQATLQNYSYASDDTATASGTTDFSGNADVTFSTTPDNETDECVDISDTYLDPIGSDCGLGEPVTLFVSYERWIGPYDVCGDYTVDNTATFTTNDTGTEGSDSWTVDVNVPCYGGCSLTPGYWKTHSDYGPAPYDDTWASLLPNGPNTPFFLSGQTYYEVLWTNPQGGNAYYILAHAYIAAELNFLNGADPTAAQEAFDAATTLFQTYTPDYVATLKGKNGNALRSEFIALAEILDNYNNGYIGPGHCSE